MYGVMHASALNYWITTVINWSKKDHSLCRDIAEIRLILTRNLVAEGPNGPTTTAVYYTSISITTNWTKIKN